MIQSFTVPGRLNGLNEYTEACRRHPHAGARMKRADQDTVLWAIKGAHLIPCRGRVRLRYRFYEAPKRKGARLRDKSNIQGFGVKVIEDALVEAGVIPDDGWDVVEGYACACIRTSEPRIVVEVEDGLA